MIIENTAWKTHQLKCDYDSTIYISIHSLSSCDSICTTFSALGREIYGIFFCHQKAINLSSVDSRSNDFLRWKMQRMFAFVFFCPCPHRIGCRFVVFSVLCATLCGIRFMRYTELYHIVHSNNKQTQLMFTIRLMWRRKKMVTSLSIFLHSLFHGYRCFCVYDNK